MPNFSVDTNLFRELGELLVSRDSTALVELIKNAYDADATSVMVHGENLNDPDRGQIKIIDDGVGMSRAQFEHGYLRIASRTKQLGDRVSVRFGWRYVGAKGIGRLAAHKLARLIEIESTAKRLETADRVAIAARIDWDAIESVETLDDVEQSRAISLSSIANPRSPRGTAITLRNLRNPWTKSARDRFLTEVQNFEPPEILASAIPRSIIDGDLLFEAPLVRSTASEDPGFEVRLEGEFAIGEDYWTPLLRTAGWLLDIDASTEPGRVKYAIVQTRSVKSERPAASPELTEMVHPGGTNGPFFQARVLVREGPLPSSAGVNRDWVRESSGIRVYMEGFRVPPYGERGNDWLQIDEGYSRRQRRLPLLADIPDFSSAARSSVGLSLLRNESYFGGVFLAQEGSSSLRVLVNREGFLDDIALAHLQYLLQVGVALSVRVRAAANEEAITKRKLSKARSRAGSRLRREIMSNRDRAEQLVEAARDHAKSGRFEASSATYAKAVPSFRRMAEAAGDVVAEDATLHVLASVGTQMASFVHEINSLLGMAENVEAATHDLLGQDMPRRTRQGLTRLESVLGNMRRAVERQASYLTDVVSADARRRRSRQLLAERFDSACRFVRRQADALEISIINDIPETLQSPPMFPAELMTVFANLLTNAVKAAGEAGEVRATGKPRRSGCSTIRIENTGRRVRPEEGERWFRPYQSTTASVDPVLGQGMGLGLPITRRTLEEYGAEIEFVTPRRSYMTAVRITFPD